MNIYHCVNGSSKSRFFANILWFFFFFLRLSTNFSIEDSGTGLHRGGHSRVCWRALLKAPRVLNWTTSWGREFQSRPVLGK